MFKLSLVEKNEIKYETSQELIERSIFLAFTTRQKGVSLDNYQSLNLAFNVKDKSEYVIKNRSLLADALNFDASRITCSQQVHGNHVHFLNKEDIGAGSNGFENAIKETDALITDVKNVPLALFFADCLPVVIVSLEPKIVAVIHAGYKGLLDGVIRETLNKLSNKCELSNAHTFLGPSIGPCCYNVDNLRVKLFSDQYPDLFSGNEKNLDLKKIASFQLNQAGINPDHIVSSKYCTYCDNDLFYSYRRNNITGRQAAIACII